MDDADRLTNEEIDTLRGVLSRGTFKLAIRQGKDTLGECMEIAEFGSLHQADPAVVEAAVREYLMRRNPYTFDRALKRIFQKTYGLPEKLVELGTPIDHLIEVAAQGNSLGDDDFQTLRDENALDKIRTGGVTGEHMREVFGPAVSRMTGIPLEIVRKQPLRKSMKGTGYAQQIGYPGALSDPEFWRDIDNLTPQVAEKWVGRARAVQDLESAERRRKLDEAWKKLLEAQIDRELELRRGRREQERLRKLRARKLRKKRPRGRPKVELEVPIEEFHVDVYVEEQVVTPGGSNYILRSYKDGTSILYRVDPDGARVILPRGRHAYQVTPDYWAGLPYVIPVLGRETGRQRTSPMDLPPATNGPAGMKP